MRAAGGAAVGRGPAAGAGSGTDQDQGQGAPLHVPGHRVAVRDTTGAGDTFTGVLAASLAAGYDLVASVGRAVAASALAVRAHGARAGMPTAAQIDEQCAAGSGIGGTS